jgi:hypothetical protein
MKITMIRCLRIERTARSQDPNERIRVTFQIGNDRESFELPVWIEANTQDDAIVPKARAELHEIARQMVEQTAKWRPPS